MTESNHTVETDGPLIHTEHPDLRDAVREGYAEIARSGQWSSVVQPTVADPAAALACLESALRSEVSEAALKAGAEDLQITVEKDIKTARAEAREIFVEAVMTAEASGRPRIAIT